jgi:hypothetical protein
MLFYLANYGSTYGLETFVFRFYRTTYTEARAANYSLNLNEWAYITAVMNGTSSVKLYLNGIEVTYLIQNPGSGAHTSDAANDLYLGNNLAGDRDFDGILDELRIDGTARSADWVKLCYETQKQGQITVVTEKAGLLPITVTHDIGTGTSDTVEISTDEWKIIFDENIGAGIKWLSFEGGGRRGGENELNVNSNLFYIRADNTNSHTVNGILQVVDSNSLFCHVRSTFNINSHPWQVDYNVYGSGRAYIRVETEALASTYDPTGGIEFRVETDVQNPDYFSETGTASTSNYILHADKGSGKYDVVLGLYEDWTQASGFTGVEGTDDWYGYKDSDWQLSSGQKQMWEFLLDFGHRKQNDTVGVGGQVDDYCGPDSLELAKGFFRLEKAWEENMIGHWTFDEKTSGGADGDTAYDFSPASHHGVIEGGDWVAGKWNSALDLDGASDSVAIVSPDDFDKSLVFTIMAWINKDGTGETNALIFGKHNPTAGEGYKLTSESNNLKITVYNTSLTGTTALGTGWRHVAVSFSKYNGWLKLFVDGKPDGIKLVDPSITESSVNVSIGNDFAGLIDDVRYYAKEISEETIRAVSQNRYRVNEGRYMVRASNNNTMELKIDGTGTVPRQFPVFQIANYWATSAPKAVYYDGAWQSTPANYIADLNDEYNILTIGFNSAVKNSGLRIYIDDNDSSGAYMTDPMPAMTWGESGSDFYVQNFGSDKFGAAGSNEFYLYWKMANTGAAGMGGELTQFKSSETEPGEDVSTADNMLPTDTTYGTFGYHDHYSTTYSSSMKHVSATPSYTVLESTDVRVRLRINERTVDGPNHDYKLTMIWTIYPTGQIFRHDKFYDNTAVLTYEFVRFRTAYEAGLSYDSSFSEYRTALWGGSAIHDHVIALTGSGDNTGSKQLLTNYNNMNFQTDVSNYMGWKFDGNSSLSTTNDPYEYAFYIDIQHNNMGSAYMDSVCEAVQNIVNTAGDMITGDLVDTTTGDIDGDGFNEGEGAYIMRASDNSVHFNLDAAGATDGCRFYPAFRIINYTAINKPKYVHLHDGSDTITPVDGYGYNAYLNDNDDELIIQFDSVFCSDVYVYISCDDDLAVTMSNFYAKAGDSNDTLFWHTESESQNLGFWLYRRVSPKFYDSLASEIDSTTPESKLKDAGLLYKRGGLPCRDTLWTPVTKEIIPGAEGGTSAGPLDYSKIDYGVHNNVLYEYKLEMVDMSMEKDEVGPISVMPIPMFPKRFMLFHNYPNPVKYYTIIRFDLPVKTKLSLNVYNLQGRLVTRIIKPGKKWKPGWYKIRWNAKSEYGLPLASGPYIYRLQAGKKYAKSRLMILVK